MTSKKITGFVTFFAVVLLLGYARHERAAPTETTAPSALLLAPAEQATLGDVTGKVFFEGTPPKLERVFMNKDPLCEARNTEPLYVEDGKVNSDSTLPNVFVYVKEGAENYTFRIPTKPVILDQRGCVYQPHVLGIMAGQVLQVLSSDPTSHNIHVMPQENGEWNQSQSPGGAPFSKKFAHPEVMIPVKCTQHPWMKAYIGVTRNPLYALTASDGTFTVKGLPSGDYLLEAWTATFGTQQQRVTVKPKETATVNFTFKAP